MFLYLCDYQNRNLRSYNYTHHISPALYRLQYRHSSFQFQSHDTAGIPHGYICIADELRQYHYVSIHYGCGCYHFLQEARYLNNKHLFRHSHNLNKLFCRSTREVNPFLFPVPKDCREGMQPRRLQTVLQFYRRYRYRNLQGNKLFPKCFHLLKLRQSVYRFRIQLQLNKSFL